MKNLESFKIQNLTREESMAIQGGSEFSESIFKAFGWLVGGIVGAYESVQHNQEGEIAMGLSPRNS